MAAYEAVEVRDSGHVREIVLNRPEVLNRIDEPLHRDLIPIFQELKYPGEIRAVVLSSTGKHFSAGGDLNEVFALHKDPAKRAAMAEQGRQLLHALIDTPVPIVVALQGDAHGLGANIVLACDANVAWRAPSFRTPTCAPAWSPATAAAWSGPRPWACCGPSGTF
jgi:enoyl-CoA hydratase